ncbi:MAG: hypothetical protein V4510_12165 [bacterium]
MTDRIATRLLAAALAAFILMTTAAGPMPATAQVKPPTLAQNPIKVLDISGRIDAPKFVEAGSDLKVMVKVQLDSIGITEIHVAPVEDATDQCNLGSVDVTGAVDLGNNDFALYNDNVTTAADSELRMHTAPPYARIALGYNSQSGVAGQCNATVDITQPLNPLAGSLRLQRVVGLLLPALPAVMGEVRSTGGWDVLDQAQVVVPAAQDTWVPVLDENPMLTLSGIVSHADGWDYGDYGHFWYNGTNANCGPMDLAEDAEQILFQCPVAIPYDADQNETVTKYCLVGYYIDGGAYDTWEEPHANTCTNVHALSPKAAITKLPITCLRAWALGVSKQNGGTPAALATCVPSV